MVTACRRAASETAAYRECVATVHRPKNELKIALTRLPYKRSIQLCLHLLDADKFHTGEQHSQFKSDVRRDTVRELGCQHIVPVANPQRRQVRNPSSPVARLHSSSSKSATAMSPQDSLKIQDFADLFGFPASAVIQAVEAQRYRTARSQAYYSIRDLAARWECSKPAVYASLRTAQAKIVNMGSGEKRKRILVDAATVARIEKSRTERMAS
jgi:hypothetical protein